VDICSGRAKHGYAVARGAINEEKIRFGIYLTRAGIRAVTVGRQMMCFLNIAYNDCGEGQGPHCIYHRMPEWAVRNGKLRTGSRPQYLPW